MEEGKSIRIETLTNEKEKEILLLLKEQKQCIYGEIIRQTNLSYSKGKELIFSMLSKGYVRYVDRTTKIELAVEII
jgi:predicted transcriptional regulator